MVLPLNQGLGSTSTRGRAGPVVAVMQRWQSKILGSHAFSAGPLCGSVPCLTLICMKAVRANTIYRRRQGFAAIRVR